MLSGVGSTAHLRSLGLPVVHDLPEVGQNSHDHMLVPILFHIDDMQITPSWFTDPRGYTYKDADPLGIRFTIFLEKTLNAGEMRLASADPHVLPVRDYRILSHPSDVECMRHAVRLAVQLAQHSAF